MGTASSSADEWIELYNTSSPDLSLEDWEIISDEGGPSSTLLSFGECSNLSITSESFYLLERTNDTTVDDISADCTYTGALGNSGETLILRSPDGNTVDTANGSGSDWPDGINPTVEPESWGTMERVDPQASDTDSNWATNNREKTNGFDVGGNPIYGTPGSKNSVYETEVSSGDGEEKIDFTFSPSEPEAGDDVTFVASSSKAGQYLWSFGEDIEATSSGATTSYKFATNDNYLVTLRLEGEELTATSTVSVSEPDSDSTTESDGADSDPEPIVDRRPQARAGKNRIVNVGREIDFDGTKSSDPNGDKLEYYWNFGDGVTKRGPTSTHSFSYPGSYLVVLRVSDGEFSDSNQLQIEVYPARIYISEFLSDPKGDDQKGEWIEVVNREDFAVNLAGFKLDDGKGGSSPFEIPEDTYLLPGQRTGFARETSGIALNNSEDAARLLYPSGDVLDKVEYSEVEEGKSAVKDGDNFLWTLYPTPGEENVVVAEDKKEGTISKAASVKEARLKRSKKIKTAAAEVDSASESKKSLMQGGMKKARRPHPAEVDFFASEALAEGLPKKELGAKKKSLEQTANLSRGAFGVAEIRLLLSVLLASGVFGLSVFLQKKGI